MAQQRRRSQTIDLMPAALRRRLGDDTAATDELWRRWLDGGDVAAFQSLVEHYAPLAFLNAVILKRCRPDFYQDNLEEMVSDGLLGLIRYLRSETRGNARGFRHFARRRIRHAMRREMLDRRFGSYYYAQRAGVIEDVRVRLVQEHGRLPTRAEMNTVLRGLIRNPDLYVDGEPAEQPLGRRDELRVDDTAARPDQALLDREVMRLAEKRLCAQDRKVLRMVMDGAGPAQVAAAIGVNKFSAIRRINGVLWETRRRAELAEYVGVEPVTATPQPSRRPPVPHLAAG